VRKVFQATDAVQPISVRATAPVIRISVWTVSV